MIRVVALVVTVMFVAGACGPAEPSEPIAVAAVIDDVEYYPGCQNEPVEIGGTTWYPLADFEFGRELDEITGQDRAGPEVGPAGFRSPAVADPGPGDDTGTLVAYADGIARYETDSGGVFWLTDDEQTYDWIC